MWKGIRAAVGAAALTGLLCAAAPAVAADRVVAVEGVAKGNSGLRVEILVVVPEGTSAKAAGDRALAQQGARRAESKKPTSQGYSFTGLYWDVLPVVQNYNPSGQPTGGAQSALTNTLPTWSNVSGSNYETVFGGTTSRCPSLVRECRGRQFNDGNNDVGWAFLANGTLGVTWSTSSFDEADMAISTRYSWNTGCTAQPGSFDLQSVILHENGHVAGLGHSTDTNAVMYPSYQTARCSLGVDDQAGIAALY